MIDPIQSLAFSIQANPGVYAVLVGSGVSRAANVLTGWGITVDLIHQLMLLDKEENDLDPISWYQQKFDKEPDYSDLLDALAKTPAERQQLLRPYFEPDDAEHEEGAKEPTVAHRAIAALAVQGFLKVIVTTNFDRLMETALEDAGIEGLTVISSPDQIRGALPLIHTRCCVFKVHGDYLDTRIRNTPDELGEYPREFDELLDRIFDEFGLIVCGWSGEWDGALRSAILRAPSRRFTTYWAVRSKPDDRAQQLISHRRAQTIPIADADTFFQTVREHVESIEKFSRPHPLSTEAAIASLKRYLPESRHRIQLSELIRDTVEKVVEMTSGEAFAVEGVHLTRESVTERVHRYEIACETLLPMALIGGYWAEKEHYPIWQQALQRLGSRRHSGGTVIWLNLQQYPATLLLYALGLGAVSNNRLQFLKHILTSPVHNDLREDVPAVETLTPFRLVDRDAMKRLLAGMDNRHAPLNDRIHETLHPYAERIIPDNNRYTLVFDKLEILMSLNFMYHNSPNPPWAPPGAFGYRYRNTERIFQEISQSLSIERNESLFVTCGLFGNTAQVCQQKLAILGQFIQRWGWGLGWS